MKVGQRVKYSRVPLVEERDIAEEFGHLRGVIVATDRTDHLSIREWVSVRWDRDTLGPIMRKFAPGKSPTWMPANLLEVVSE